MKDGTPILAITNGTSRVNLLALNGFYLINWMPASAEAMSIKMGSMLGEGSSIHYRVIDRVTDTFSLGVRGWSQDKVIAMCHEADQLLEKAVAYWGHAYLYEPVWIEARAPKETNTRYAVIRDWSIAGHTSMYAQPFYNAFGQGMDAQDNLSLTLIHDPWQDGPPGSGVCVQNSAVQTFPVVAPGGGLEGDSALWTEPEEYGIFENLYETVDMPESLLGEAGPAPAPSYIDIGQEATCANQVYVGNSHKDGGQLTDIYYYDASLVAWSANLFNAATPYGFLPAVPGDGDCVYFGQDTVGTLDRGPFCSLVFDISARSVYGGVATIEWEYWNGAWVALTNFHDPRGSANGGSGASWDLYTGVQSVHWAQPTDWTTTAVNGVTGFWVRARCNIPGGGDSISQPVQQNRTIYTIATAHIEIDSAQTGGDIPMFARLRMQCWSDIIAPAALLPAQISRIHVGLRSLSRGAEFQAYLPCGSNMTPAGQVTQSMAPAGAAVTFPVDSPLTAYGEYTSYVTVAATNMADVISVYMGGPLATAIMPGTYRVMVRYQRTNGADGDVRMRLRITTDPYGAGRTTPQVLLSANNNQEVADFGRITLAPWGMAHPATVIDGTIFIQLANDIAASRTVYLYDVILIPADEWYACLERDTGTSTNLEYWNVLDTDSVSVPRDRRIAIVRDWVNGDRMLGKWIRQSSGPNVLQANADQRLWFFMQQYENTASPWGELFGQWEMAMTVQTEGIKRYKWARGDR